MGYSNSTYTGPYILVDSKISEESYTETINPVTGKKHKNGDLFCPITGTKLKVFHKVREVESKLRFFEEPLIEDLLSSPTYLEIKGKSVFILNKNRPYSFSTDDTDIFDISTFNIVDILNKFKEDIAEYTTFLTNNGWKFSIHYGTVCYAH